MALAGQPEVTASMREKMMRLYLDNCAFNRPFDDQSHIRVRLEAEAKLYLQGRIEEGKTARAWSYILDIENDQNPFEEKKNAIAKWKRLAVVDVEETESLKERADSFVASGVKAKDVLHVSAAIEGKADFFITTDDRLLKKLAGTTEIQAANPIDVVGEFDDNHN
uniref:PIN domain-containing protein n=1 Tax=Candidatus Kentrum sp. UNK TaxID=2126344 RepID=A0A451B0Q9_9GAMM|nr:MAG: hypothetical protein BECKUNK1418G_GA0071005_10966 [Candidatus Kentron sp. UNK]VFK71863.1 MAG: hypothetical protein BECKUNK1418H_GA0071006_10856 [Candidatus Kentron sp. UNK]